MYLLKRSKTCTWSWCFPHDEEVKRVLGHDDFFHGDEHLVFLTTLFPCGVLLQDLFFSTMTIIHTFQLDTIITAGGARDVGKSGTNEDTFLHL